jgi:hypothetical protein
MGGHWVQRRGRWWGCAPIHLILLHCVVLPVVILAIRDYCCSGNVRGGYGKGRRESKNNAVIVALL